VGLLRVPLRMRHVSVSSTDSQASPRLIAGLAVFFYFFIQDWRAA